MANFLSGMIIGLEIPLIVVFQWNPSTVTRNKGTGWAQIKPAGREAPIFHYGCGFAQIYSFTAHFSRSDNSNAYVAAMIESLITLTKPLVKGAGVDRPPLVKLLLGSMITTTGIIHDIKTEYGPLFNPHSLAPYNAKFNITIHEVIP